MIVDDLMSTGGTHILTSNLVDALDPEHEYRGFLFDQGNELDIMPWSGYDTFVQNKVSDWEDPTFLSKRDPNPGRRKEGLQLRRELDQLAGEIAAEKGVILPPVYQFDLEAIK